MTIFAGSIEARLIEIGYGKPVEISSVWGSPENARQLLPACFGFQSDFAFHTDYEERPFILVDLLSVRPVKRIRIFNREAVPERALPLVVSTSPDRAAWTDIARINYVFGGRASAQPLELLFKDQVRFRYLKIWSDAKTILHLEHVEISTLLPTLNDGRLQNVDASGPRTLAQYCHHSSYGFTWTFTATLMAISNCRIWDVTISRPDYSACLAPFKSEPGIDLYPVFFEPEPIGARHDALLPVQFNHHDVYATLDLAALREYAALYFRPAAAVRAFSEELAAAYGLRPDNAIALVYRGTDKWSEVRPAPIERYIEAALAARRGRPDLQVIIQTDQEQAVRAVLAAIPDAIYFKELPVSTGATVMHHLPLEREFNISKITFAIRMLGVIELISRFRYVVTHTGNIGLWIALYRGGAAGFYQFDTNTDLRGPDGGVVEDVAGMEVR